MDSHGCRPSRSTRRRSHGQVMAIFALLALFLFAVTGLAVAAGLAYLADNGAERAAAASALAGVPYMPANFSSGDCTGTGSANGAACAAAARNGFGNGTMRNGHPVSVTVRQYPAGCTSTCDPNKLTVSVT